MILFYNFKTIFCAFSLTETYSYFEKKLLGIAHIVILYQISSRRNIFQSNLIFLSLPILYIYIYLVIKSFFKIR